MNEQLITLDGITVRKTGTVLLDSVSLTVARGELVGVIGPTAPERPRSSMSSPGSKGSRGY
jgi:ABC-type uncharacterized transport system YnjBCD ATPase subunit